MLLVFFPCSNGTLIPVIRSCMILASDKSSFELGAVVVPARNGMLSELGYDLNQLGDKALGLVISEGSSRVLVHFPDLKITLWLDTTELADVKFEASKNLKSYQELIPNTDIKKLSAVWLLNYLMKEVSLVEFLEIEHGDFSKIWDESDSLNLESSDDSQIKAMRVGLGIEGLSPEKIESLNTTLSNRLLALRLHPAGMHKFEARFYLAH